MLSWLGLEFEVRDSGFDESGIMAEDPRVLTGGLALAKAQTVAEAILAEITPSVIAEKELAPNRNEPILVLGADTVVWHEGEMIGKPNDFDHAREILKKLRGKKHEVYSGVAVVEVLTKKQASVVEKSEVVLKNYHDSELENYLATGEPMGKAGAYMILGKARDLAEEVIGSITNVTGLPLKKTAGLLAEMGVKIEVDVERTVLKKTGFPD